MAKNVKAGGAFVEIALRDKLAGGLKRASKRLKSFAGTTSAIGAGLAGVSASIIGPIGAAVAQFSSTGDAVQKMAARTGMSAEAVSELSFAAGQSGTDVKTLENGVRRMQQTVTDAGDGISTGVDALDKLGMSASDLEGLSPEDQFAKISDGIAAIEDPAARTSAAMDIFGRSGAQLIPMMAGGAAGIQEMRDNAKALGMTISGDTAQSAADLTDALGAMWATIKGLTLNIGAALAPAITSIVTRISPLIAVVTQFIQRNKRLVTIIASVAAGIGIAGGVMIAIGSAAGVVAFAFSGLASIVATAGSVIGTVLAAIFSPIGLIVAAVIGVVGAFLYFSGVGGKAIAWLQSRFGSMVAFVTRVTAEIRQAIASGDYGGAARILWSAVITAFQAALTEVQGIWSAMVASAKRVMSNLAEMLGPRLVGVIVGAWSRIKSVADALFGDLWASAKETFGAIAGALAGGDFSLAAEIAMTSIKLAFAQGMAYVTNAWTEFTTGLASIFDGAVVAVRQTWNNISTWIADKILKLVGLIQTAVARLAALDPTGLSDRLAAAIDFDVEGAISILQDDSDRFNRNLDEAKQDRDDSRATAMQNRLAETERNLAELRERRNAALEQEPDGSQLSGLLDGLKSMFAGMPTLATPQDVPLPPEMEEQRQQVSAATGPTLGTFSASVAGMLGRSAESAVERTAEAAEATVEKLSSIDDELKNRPSFALEE